MVAFPISSCTVNDIAPEKNFWVTYREKKRKKVREEIQVTLPADEALGNNTLAFDKDEDDAPIEPVIGDLQQKLKPVWDPDKNHGRYGAVDYSGCPTLFVAHEDIKAGDFCQECKRCESNGKLYEAAPSRVVHLTGNPLITGVQYVLSRLRCSLCEKYFVASLPEKARNRGKYDETCRSSLAMARYYTGLPFYRIQQLQTMQGVPLADATQWDLMRQLYQVVLPVYQVLEQCAAQGHLVHHDDTGNRIIEFQKARKATHTTALISMLGNHAIYLFYTSGYVGGKNVELLLEHRTTKAPLMTMSDASSHNIPKYMDENLVARWILCFCLVHGRRKFYEIQHLYSKECELVLDIISKIYHHEAYCKKNQLSAHKRLEYHQEHSAPLMKALKVWLNNQLLHHLHEPNSPFGQAVAYLLRHWQALTRFLEVAGAPLDNSLCEQAIKVAIRHRRNSLFYKTLHGAQVGDCLMSLIHTAAKAQVNLFDYLNALQRHAAYVKIKPSRWLPWNYQKTLQSLLRAPPTDKAA